MVKKRKKKIKKMAKPNLRIDNEDYWLTITKRKDDIEAFAERGNEKQKKTLKKVIEYRLWQIQEGHIEKDFFKKNDIDVKSLKIDIKAPPKPRKKVEKEEVEEVEEVEIINLFDIKNVKEFKKEK